MSIKQTQSKLHKKKMGSNLYMRMWRHGLLLGLLMALAFAFASERPTHAQSPASCDPTNARCRSVGSFSSFAVKPGASPAMISVNTPAMGALLYEDFVKLETLARQFLKEGMDTRLAISPYRNTPGFEQFLKKMDFEAGWNQQYVGTNPYGQPMTFLQLINKSDQSLARARNYYAYLALFAPEARFRSDPAYSAALCARPEDPNPVDQQNTGQVLDPVIDWCNFQARMRQSVREATNIRMIIGQEFMVDALGLNYSADLVGGEAFVRKEIALLRAANHQFVLAEKFLNEGFNAVVGNGCRLADFYTTTEWSLLSRITEQQGVIQYHIGARLSYLDVTSAQSEQAAKLRSANAIRKGATENYAKLIGLSSLTRSGVNGCPLSDRPDSDAIANMVNNLATAKIQAQNMALNLNIFGFDVNLTPSAAFKSSVTMNCNSLTEGTLGLWDLAKCTAEEARVLQATADQKQREFEQSQTQLLQEVDKVRKVYDTNIIDNIVGCSSDTQSEADFFNCANTQIKLAGECLGVVSTANLVYPEGSRFPIIDNSIFSGCMNRIEFNKANDITTNLKELSSIYLQYLNSSAAAQNLEKRIMLSEDANSTVTTWLGLSGTANTAANMASATHDAITCLDFDNPLSTATSSGACAATGSANVLAQMAAGAMSTAADVEIANATNKSEIENLMLDYSELLFTMESAQQAYFSKQSDVTGILTALERDVTEAARQRAYFRNSPANDPSFRMVRDSTRLQLADKLEEAAKYAYLAARRAEYEYAAQFAKSTFRISDIYRARTAQDIINYLNALRDITVLLPGGAIQDQRLLELDTISVAKHILFLDDASLRARGYGDDDIPEMRTALFREWVQQHTILNNGKPQLVFTMTTSLLDEGLFAALNPEAHDQRWRMRMTGINTPIAGSTGMRLNLVTDQQNLGYRAVSVTQGGLVHLRSQAGCIYDYRLMHPAVLLGLDWPRNQDAAAAFSAFNASINTPSFSTDPNFMAGEFLGRAVSASEWKIVISSGSPTGGSSLPEMDLQQLNDIEFKISATFTSRPPGKPAPNDCARVDY